MFLSKECFRLACLSHTTGREGWQKMINLMWLSLPLAALVASSLSWVWVSLLPSPEPHLMSQYTKAVWIVGASGVLQMLAEPPWVAAQLMLLAFLVGKFRTKEKVDDKEDDDDDTLGEKTKAD